MVDSRPAQLDRRQSWPQPDRSKNSTSARFRNSNQIRVFSDLPLIRETGIQEARGAFDTNAFLQGKFDRANDPVGNTLTTGGASRFRQDEWSFEAGVKKKFITGTEVSPSRRTSRRRRTTPIYFVAEPAVESASSQLSVVQPLLKGAGVGYNRSHHPDRAARFGHRDAGVHPAKRIASARNHPHLLGALRGAHHLSAKGAARR